MVTSGCLVVSLTVPLSTASILSTDDNRPLLMNLGSLVRKRLRLKTTSSAVRARPFTGGLLCHFTPGARWKTYSVGDGVSHLFAISGSGSFVTTLPRIRLW